MFASVSVLLFAVASAEDPLDGFLESDDDDLVDDLVEQEDECCTEETYDCLMCEIQDHREVCKIYKFYDFEECKPKRKRGKDKKAKKPKKPKKDEAQVLEADPMQECCDELTFDCLLCEMGGDKRKVCKEFKDYMLPECQKKGKRGEQSEPEMCCDAMEYDCLLCALGSHKKVCKVFKNYKFDECEEPKPVKPEPECCTKESFKCLMCSLGSHEAVCDEYPGLKECRHATARGCCTEHSYECLLCVFKGNRRKLCKTFRHTFAEECRK